VLVVVGRSADSQTQDHDKASPTRLHGNGMDTSPDRPSGDGCAGARTGRDSRPEESAGSITAVSGIGRDPGHATGVWLPLGITPRIPQAYSADPLIGPLKDSPPTFTTRDTWRLNARAYRAMC
jgi:hypothetical protein